MVNGKSQACDLLTGFTLDKEAQIMIPCHTMSVHPKTDLCMPVAVPGGSKWIPTRDHLRQG